MNKLYRWVHWADCGLLFLLGFLLWLLNHPYQGVWHDARIYGLLAANWLNPAAYAKDLFFSFGSQGSFSLFTPLYGGLVASLGLDRAAWWVTLSGGLLWIGACLALARTMLGNGFGARFAVLLGAVVVISYSPSRSIFVIGENFGTARSWALPLVLASVAALAAQRQAWSLGFGLAAAALHPLHGVWAVALWVSSQLGTRLAVLVALVPIAFVVLLGVINLDLPHLRLMTGDWLAFAWGAIPDITFGVPGQTRLPIYAGVLLVLWLGSRQGSEKWRLLYERLLLLGVSGLGIALLASHMFPVEIVVQGQAWRVMALLLPMAAVALIDLGQRAWRSSAAGRFIVGVVGVLASMGTHWLVGALYVIVMASLLPSTLICRIELSSARWRRWLTVVLTLLTLSVVPNMLAAWEIAGSQWLNPWWTGTEWLQGFIAGGFWHLAGLLALALGLLSAFGSTGEARKQSPVMAIIFVLGLITFATGLALGHWDRRTEKFRMSQACYLDAKCPPHPFRRWIAPGSVVFWPERELMTWFELGTASYFGPTQAIGKVFSSAKFYELQRREFWIEAGTDPRHLCADSVIDWVVLPYPVFELSARTVHGDEYLYACSDLRVLPSVLSSSRLGSSPRSAA